MLKTVVILFCSLSLAACAEFNEIVKDLPALNGLEGVTQTLSSADIAQGLKEALNQGVSRQVSTLTQTNGFYKNDRVKIKLPEELRKVDNGLRKMGMGKLADEGVMALNRAAEDAVGRSTPIFVSAIKNMSIADAKSILMGSQDSATRYLQANTSTKLYQEFKPEIRGSFERVGANTIWNNIFSRYNAIPFVDKVNPDLTDYVTTQALQGVYTMIAVEELSIRQDFGARTSTLLKDVFALQDKK